MIAPKDLRRPINWQDFETLCTKLWGEVWDCPNIKKNGRTGQSQNGVDISGIPKGQRGYFGIQCKGKDSYTAKQFTTEEIDREIEKAKKFKPQLLSLYFATTAVKDAAIEEYIRTKNIEHIEQGLFEVELFSWEDIVDKIIENPKTYQYYVNNQNYLEQTSIGFCLNQDKQEIKDNVDFQKTFIKYVQEISFYRKITTRFEFLKDKQESSKINKSLYPFCFTLKNEGVSALEDITIKIEIKGNHLDIIEDNKVENYSSLLSNIIVERNKRHNFHSIDKNNITLNLMKAVLVSENTWTSQLFYIKCSPFEVTQLRLNWFVLTRNGNKSGGFKVELTPRVKKRYIETLTDDPIKANTIEESVEVEDILEDVPNGVK